METQAQRTKSALTTGADPELVKTRALDAPKVVKEAPARMSREEFEALSPPEQRRAVARDVLAQLEAGTYTAAHLLYAQVDLREEIADKIEQELGHRANSGACFVCGVGSVFMSTMLMSNPTLTVAEVAKADAGLSGREEREKVRSTFGQKQLALIETAYEAGNSYGSCSRYGLGDYMAGRADNFCKDKERGRPRLEAIMQNIVKYGEFRP